MPLIGVAPLSNIEYHTSELILIMTIIGGSSGLFGSVLGAAFYLLAADALSTVWPRWLLLGLVLITVALFLQRGLWGLVERGYDLAFRRGAHTDDGPGWLSMDADGHRGCRSPGDNAGGLRPAAGVGLPGHR